MMDTAERKQIAEAILSRVDGRVPVAIHVGSPATHNSVDLAKHAEAAGATIVAVVSPFYYGGFAYKEDDFLKHFETIVKAVKVPVWIYNNPKTTGYRASVDLLKRMANSGVSGLKDSTGDYMYLVEVIREVRKVCPEFSVTAGTAGLFQALYYQGSDACIAGTANVFPKLLSSLYSLLLTPLVVFVTLLH
ncbi:MAG: dihydrodipicolinate synthase family protein [candidate division Zixibacteria bacterium]|nr:dihydrodipicolinate synthase family protein [candidate division Zixibacteria bacterium]